MADDTTHNQAQDESPEPQDPNVQQEQAHEEHQESQDQNAPQEQASEEPQNQEPAGNDEAMQPENAPTDNNGGSGHHGKILNGNIKLWLILGVMAVAVIAAYAMFSKNVAHMASEDDTQKDSAGNLAAQEAESLTGMYRGGMSKPDVPQDNGIVGEQPKDQEQTEQGMFDEKGHIVPKEPEYRGDPHQFDDIEQAPAPDPVEQERMQSRREAFRKALSAPSGVDFKEPEARGHSASQSSGRPGSIVMAGSYQSAANMPQMPQMPQMPEEIQSFGPDGMPVPNAGSRRSGSRSAKAYQQFDSDDDSRWTLNHSMKSSAPYSVQTGSVIPAVMISGVNSDLAGQLIAQVSQSVYDSPSGRYLLIPQGTRLIGAYSADVMYGQERVLVAWQRLIFPDGRTLDLGSMPGADQAGFSGFTDTVNNHLWRIYRDAFLLSAVVGAVAYNQDRSSSNTDSDKASASSSFSEALGQNLGQTSSELIRKNMAISPTIEVRPGYRFNVVVTKDLTFAAPYLNNSSR